MDFTKHNEEVRALWKAFEEGHPFRVPIVFNFSRRFWLLNPKLNVERYTFQDYFEDPDVMFDVQMKAAHWLRHNIPQDQEMGIPESHWNGIHVDFQNSYEAAWFGCPIRYLEGDVPDTEPILQDNKALLYEMETPNPLTGNLMGKAFEYYQYFEDKRKHTEFHGRPLGKTTAPTGTDGPFTIACSLRGATELCLDIYEAPEYVHDLMHFITEGIIKRCQAWMDLTGIPSPRQSFGFADDSIALLSVETYREFVLPYHRRLVNAFSAGGPNSIHLCGSAAHLFKPLMTELNIESFETGYPVDLGRIRRDLGPDVLLKGNIHPELLRLGPPEHIRRAVTSLLQSGVMDGGRFILSEGHNVAPGTPTEHFEVMYDSGRELGKYK